MEIPSELVAAKEAAEPARDPWSDRRGMGFRQENGALFEELAGADSHR